MDLKIGLANFRAVIQQHLLSIIYILLSIWAILGFNKDHVGAGCGGLLVATSPRPTYYFFLFITIACIILSSIFKNKILSVAIMSLEMFIWFDHFTVLHGGEIGYGSTYTYITPFYDYVGFLLRMFIISELLLPKFSHKLKILFIILLSLAPLTIKYFARGDWNAYLESAFRGLNEFIKKTFVDIDDLYEQYHRKVLL